MEYPSFDDNTPQIDRHKKLRILGHFMKTLPPEKLDMGTWADTEECTRTSCGSIGCAAGWSVCLFHDDGLHLSDGWFALKFDKIYVNSGADAFARFFGLPNALAQSIVYYSTEAAISTYMREAHPEVTSYEREFGIKREHDITPVMVSQMIDKILTIVNPELMATPMPEEDVIVWSDLKEAGHT